MTWKQLTLMTLESLRSGKSTDIIQIIQVRSQSHASGSNRIKIPDTDASTYHCSEDSFTSCLVKEKNEICRSLSVFYFDVELDGNTTKLVHGKSCAYKPIGTEEKNGGDSVHYRQLEGHWILRTDQLLIADVMSVYQT